MGKLDCLIKKRVLRAVIINACSAKGTTNVRKKTVKVDAIPPTTPKRSKKLIAYLLVTSKFGLAVS